MYGFCPTHKWQSPTQSTAEPCPTCVAIAQRQVPRIVRDIEEQIVPDVKNVAGVIGSMFFGDFWEKAGFSDKPLESGTMLPSYQPVAIAPPTVIDVPPSTGCFTCGGTRKVGQPGHQVQCPVCGDCATCGGTGLVGAKGHEVGCPICTAAKK